MELEKDICNFYFYLLAWIAGKTSCVQQAGTYGSSPVEILKLKMKIKDLIFVIALISN